MRRNTPDGNEILNLFDRKNIQKYKKQPLFVPKIYSCQKYFKGQLNMIVSHYNEVNTMEESSNIELSCKREEKITTTFRSKVKKTLPKKKLGLIDDNSSSIAGDNK